MLFSVRGGPSSSPGEPQAAACSTSRGASRVMTKCNRIKIQKSNILLQPGTTVTFFVVYQFVVVVVVSHIQRIGCQPEKNYFTRWPIPLVVC